MLDTFIKHILGEVRMIADAPTSFVIAVLATALLIWIALDWRYGGIISNKDSEIVIVKAQRDDYQAKLGGSSPDQAKARIDDLENQLRVLRGQVEPRHLRPEQRQAITQSARVAGGMHALIIVHEGGRPDCPLLAADFENVFRNAGWQVGNGVVMGPAQRPTRGIALMIPDPNNLSADAEVLQRALRAAQIEVELMRRPFNQAPEIELFITARPVP
jgi:hypothetical protein